MIAVTASLEDIFRPVLLFWVRGVPQGPANATFSWLSQAEGGTPSTIINIINGVCTCLPSFPTHHHTGLGGFLKHMLFILEDHPLNVNNWHKGGHSLNVNFLNGSSSFLFALMFHNSAFPQWKLTSTGTLLFQNHVLAAFTLASFYGSGQSNTCVSQTNLPICLYLIIESSFPLAFTQAVRTPWRHDPNNHYSLITFYCSEL